MPSNSPFAQSRGVRLALVLATTALAGACATVQPFRRPIRLASPEPHGHGAFLLCLIIEAPIIPSDAAKWEARAPVWRVGRLGHALTAPGRVASFAANARTAVANVTAG